MPARTTRESPRCTRSVPANASTESGRPGTLAYHPANGRAQRGRWRWQPARIRSLLRRGPGLPRRPAIRHDLHDRPDGAPRPAVVWYTVDGDEIVINSAVGRRWPSNLVRDPRIAFSVVDSADGYRWVGLSGSVTVMDHQPTAQADIAAMCRRYHADEPEEAERLDPRAVPAAAADQLPAAAEPRRRALRLTDATRRRARRRGRRGQARRRAAGRPRR